MARRVHFLGERTDVPLSATGIWQTGRLAQRLADEAIGVIEEMMPR